MLSITYNKNADIIITNGSNHLNAATKQIPAIPHLSDAAAGIISKALAQQGSQCGLPEPTKTLKNKVSALQTTCEKLKTAKDNAKRNKIISIVVTAISTVLLATAILCAVGIFGTGGLAIGMGVTAMHAWLLLTVGSSFHYLALDAKAKDVISESIETDAIFAKSTLFAFTPLPLFIPIWQTFRRELQINREIEAKTNEVQQELKKAVPQQIEYYQKNSVELIATLEKYLSLADQSYTDARKQPIYIAESITLWQKEFDQAKNALEEVKAASAFYAQLLTTSAS